MDITQLTTSIKDLLTQFCEANAIGYKYIASLKKNKEFSRFITSDFYKSFFNIGTGENLRSFYKQMSINDIAVAVRKDSNGKYNLVVEHWEYEYDEYVKYQEPLHDIYFLNKKTAIHQGIDNILLDSIKAYKLAEAEYALAEANRKKVATDYELKLYKKLKKKFEK